MAGPRKVRIFRDLKKSPSWYVEWRDASGKRHCESCGPRRRDARERATQIEEELRLQREQATRVVPIFGQPADFEMIPGSSEVSGVEDNTLQLQGQVRCQQVELPITIRLEVPAVVATAMRQAFCAAAPQQDQPNPANCGQQ